MLFNVKFTIIIERLGLRSGHPPSTVLITGKDKPFRTVLSRTDYADVRRLGDEYKARVPRSVLR